MFKLNLALSFASLLASVSGHGYVQQITAGSAVYTGYLPYTDPYYRQAPLIAFELYLTVLHPVPLYA